MNHPDYIKKRDEILTKLVNYYTNADAVDTDLSYGEAAQAIDALVLEVIGSNEEETWYNADLISHEQEVKETAIRRRNHLRQDIRRTVQGDK